MRTPLVGSKVAADMRFAGGAVNWCGAFLDHGAFTRRIPCGSGVPFAAE